MPVKKPFLPLQDPPNAYLPFVRRRYRAILSQSQGAFQIDPSGRPHVLPHASAQTQDSADRYGLPAQYHVPPVTLEPHERTPRPLPPTNPNNRAPRKLLYIVSFKCARVECFYLLDNTGLEVNEGDMVIVEADRGQDLGMVQHARVTPEEARILKRKYAEEQYKWLMMFSQNNQQGAVNPNAPGANSNSNNGATNSNAVEISPIGASRSANGNGSLPPRPYPFPGAAGGPMLNKEDIFNLKPKAIKRIANANEVRMLMDKEGNEAKAKRSCQAKVNLCRLDMEILDAEWQWDFNKIIFYYYADHYINFQALITELYRIYKTRIWLSAVNPASFSPAATGQMPFGFGPGAILSTQYGSQQGQDPDPHGAVRPYTLEYNTYDPNYPAIPGVPNSFPQGVGLQGGYNQPNAQYQSHGAVGHMNQDYNNRHLTSYNNDYLNMMGQFSGVSLGNTRQQASTSPAYGSTVPPHNQTGVNTVGTPSASSSAAGSWLQPGMQHRRESVARAAGIGRQQNPPAPIGTRPVSSGDDTMSAFHLNGSTNGHQGTLGGVTARGAAEAQASSRTLPLGLTFGAMHYDNTNGGGQTGNSMPPGLQGDEETSTRMRAYLDNGGANWGR
ncbi:PSP1-domain-containing protein [Polychaeton citri CBS 116435]|uniref:PSP1-domain-containing protein n=1 Tax=Polychaeton citri CBS 116435 TaxID=1314669 RepID=A0A9P4Q4P0_9PEZI|nr:PSP1-domain-containing protein [Polychaeton citri CBS 116435]